MKFVFAVVAICVAAVGCQAQGPPPSAAGPPPSGPPSSMTKPAPPPMQGCSPGCGPTDICVALADNYVRPGQRSSVCAKMSSIRFPTAALSSILKVPGAAQVPVPRIEPAAVQSGPAYMPQQFQRQNQGSNMLFPIMMMGGMDLGLGF